MVQFNKNLLTFSAIIITFLFSLSCKKSDQNYPETVIDIDGNTYNTVLIGDQLWMKENLITTKFSNGDPIATTDPIDKSISLESEPIYQWFYFEDKPNPSIYGRFYTWFAVVDSRNICPEGWHVPTNEEWKTMINNLGGNEIAGGKLKETNPDYWVDINIGATNSSGFGAVPTSIRFAEGFLALLLRNDAFFWTTVESDFIYEGEKNFAISFLIKGDKTNIYEQATVKNSGLTCRCIMNTN